MRHQILAVNLRSVYQVLRHDILIQNQLQFSKVVVFLKFFENAQELLMFADGVDSTLDQKVLAKAVEFVH